MSEEALEEQENEIMVLESIFMENFKILNEEDPKKFEITIKPDDLSEEDILNAPILKLIVQYTPNYPEESPTYSLESVQYLSFKMLEDFTKKIDKTFEESLGMACIYQLVYDLKNDLMDFSGREEDKGTKTELTEEEIELQKREEEQKIVKDRLKYGTPLTKELFEKWNKEFYKEKDEEKQKKLSENELIKKPTGIDFWKNQLLLDEKNQKEKN
ncbi:rwd domain-containing protein [Anaeramoeba flamelloides]|uniref:Rwd domain-containing protein n=1 Tax=Anaeramoeba flamelloides TaxID=1746091 RepID=A0AAV7ZTB0_9EUKA|nr:rwd domain-containing protein [Anaeramoeba flamelloides]